MKHRKKIISNKSFAAIWEAASKAASYRELCNMAYESKHFSPAYMEKNSGIGLEELYIVLENIYKAYNMTFEEIMTKAGTTNSKLRDCFCIPEKSIEAWKSGRNKCPDYIRLMILRYYHLINLGKYIYTEEYDNFLNTIPKVYEESDKNKTGNKVANKKTDRTNKKAKDETDQYNSEDDDFNDLINSFPSLSQGIDTYFENVIKNKKSSIVNKTDYLDDILKNRKNKKE